VGKPGRLELQPGSKLSDYVNLAGGPTVKANLSSVSITRQENGKAKVYNINMSEVLQKGNLKYDVELYGGDVVFIPGNFFYFSDFGSFASTIFTAIALYNIFTNWR
jgi:protein involved in polysaccharide export with SLBB domain